MSNDICTGDSFCGHPKQYSIDLEDDNVTSTRLISYGIATFDNIGKSLLTVFQVLTMSGWSTLMYNVRINI